MTSSPPNPDDPNAWTVGQVRNYRAQHGHNPPGLRRLDAPELNRLLGIGSAADLLAKHGEQQREQIKSTIMPKPAEINIKSIEDQAEEYLEKFREREDEREAEHQADRALMREQTEIARQQAKEAKESNKRSATALFVAWASLGVAIISVVVSIALAIYTRHTG